MSERHYTVTWTIDVWADSPEEAAHKALRTQRDNDSIATVFDIKDMETQETETIDTLAEIN